MISQITVLGLVLFLASSPQTQLVEAEVVQCGAVQCHHGTCVGNECKCYPNFSAEDCSVPFRACPDGIRTCFNGSICVKNNKSDPVTKTYRYHCDCKPAYGVSSYAGHQCEHSATMVCEANKATSAHAFCTNGGKCRNVVVGNEKFKGCDCGDDSDFEGTHCQYLKGTAPPEDLPPSNERFEEGSEESSGGGGISGVAIFFIVLSCVGVVMGFAFMLLKTRSQRENIEPPVVNASEMEMNSENNKDVLEGGGKAVEII